MSMATQPDGRLKTISAALSAARLGPYLTLTGGSVQSAVRLYEWNMELSGAVYETLHIVEVALRNAIDQRLSQWNAAQVDRRTGQLHSPEWVLDPSHLLMRLVSSNLSAARHRARVAVKAGEPGGRAVTHGDVVAQLTFGTWRYLLPDTDPGRQLLWNKSLNQAFPYLAGTELDLVSKVDGIYRLRNRVAHLEPVLRGDLVRDQYNNMRDVLEAIDPTLRDWFISNQRVTRTLRTRPPAP